MSEKEKNGSGSRNKPSVVIIEDDPFILDIISHKFTKKSWDVTSTMNGEQGLEEIGKVMPDIVLLDILLPGMNGYEVLTKLKSDGKLKSIPVLVLSNYGQEEEIQRSRDLGAVDHYVKAHVILDEVVAKAEEIIAHAK